ncbi:hypothetical protein MPLA_1670002 [Mesorhizobium sp. ORS 3359]|nr:hypothetical protein MPLA_1670002 [Mesorhizobium sp. ORS 3359]
MVILSPTPWPSLVLSKARRRSRDLMLGSPCATSFERCSFAGSLHTRDQQLTLLGDAFAIASLKTIDAIDRLERSSQMGRLPASDYGSHQALSYRFQVWATSAPVTEISASWSRLHS